MDLTNLNHGEVTSMSPKTGTPSPNFHTTPTIQSHSVIFCHTDKLAGRTGVRRRLGITKCRKCHSDKSCGSNKQRKKSRNSNTLMGRKVCTTKGVQNYDQKSTGRTLSGAAWNSLHFERFVASLPSSDRYSTDVVFN
ncbi:hypothetical protein TNCV_2486211 [Trichonephila clavipes]|uniref:Uncharacterized protein n=1 Tax=Trichonephila clavipes TaxID=2585209 RepID=A0A8X7BAZ0_TRICX|nr:hypothetical protein TNCV_2486211 [Trichonephila clavipes]